MTVCVCAAASEPHKHEELHVEKHAGYCFAVVRCCPLLSNITNTFRISSQSNSMSNSSQICLHFWETLATFPISTRDVLVKSARALLYSQWKCADNLKQRFVNLGRELGCSARYGKPPQMGPAQRLTAPRRSITSVKSYQSSTTRFVYWRQKRKKLYGARSKSLTRAKNISLQRASKIVVVVRTVRCLSWVVPVRLEKSQSTI